MDQSSYQHTCSCLFRQNFLLFVAQVILDCHHNIFAMMAPWKAALPVVLQKHVPLKAREEGGLWKDLWWLVVMLEKLFRTLAQLRASPFFGASTWFYRSVLYACGDHADVWTSKKFRCFKVGAWTMLDGLRGTSFQKVVNVLLQRCLQVFSVLPWTVLRAAVKSRGKRVNCNALRATIS